MANSGWVDQTSVDTIASITQEDSETARQLYAKALKQHNGDAERVINDYYAAGTLEAFASKYTYDESQWSAGRDGDMPDLVVHGPDEHPTGWESTNGNLNPFSAPSRPPSRNKSPLGKVTDWALQSASAPTDHGQEDAELQKAIALSMNDVGSGGATPQESGITTAPQDLHELPFFGPATHNHHKPDEWAMIRAAPRSLDPPPSARKRDTGVPGFLVCRESTDQRHPLGPLMMILHEIPAARNFFLLLEGASEKYGSDNGWWRGEHIVAIPPDGFPSGDVSLVDESQRLIAFLDQGDRSYGTADSLCANSLMRSGWGDRTVKFFESLYNCSTSQELPRMWTTVKVDSGGEIRPQEFAILEFKILNDTPEAMCNLYSQWDSLFWIQHDGNHWQDEPDKELTIASIEVPAKVMTMRVTTDGTRIEIPQVLYIDRYLESNVETARKMQNQMFSMWKAIGKAREMESELTQVKTKAGATADMRDVLQKLIARSEGLIWQVRGRALWRKHEEQAGTDEQIPYLTDQLIHLIEPNEEEKREITQLEAEIQGCKQRLARIDQKLSSIKVEKDACFALLKKLNTAFTVPSEDPKLNPDHKYTLRGVITSSDVVYLCRRKEREPFVDTAEDIDQWFRIAWVPDEESPVNQEQTTIEKVMENMFTEVMAKGEIAPILVYATDEALDEAPVHLSAARQTFIKYDNRLFKQELIEQPELREKKRVGFRSPESPAKRQRSNSGDSMDSNRASPGDMSDGDRDAIWNDQMEPFGGGEVMDTEMTDMRPISEDEIAAHMVPPTPPLSTDGTSDQDSPPVIRRSTEQLANMSLDDHGVETGKAPEMEELQTPFIVRRPASAQGVDHRESAMSWPVIDESLAIPGRNPEEFYHQP